MRAAGEERAGTRTEREAKKAEARRAVKEAEGRKRAGKKRPRRETRRGSGRTNSIARSIACSLQWKKLRAIQSQSRVIGAVAVAVLCA
ncbi:MAG: hypothetical protein LUH36_09275, partial [Oscillospiraceae bacterium]|nr:hypothetical protein [Oscillospiraceae bacterium]